jgi:hypothetical protein
MIGKTGQFDVVANGEKIAPFLRDQPRIRSGDSPGPG